MAELRGILSKLSGSAGRFTFKRVNGHSNGKQIHRFSKILLHNREDLVNFDQVLGISSLHRKSGALFFKATDFQELLWM